MTRPHRTAGTARRLHAAWRPGAAALTIAAIAAAVGVTLPSAAAWVDPAAVGTSFAASEAATEPVADACAGDGYSLMLTPSGTVFGVGRNDNGALGNGTTGAISTPRAVLFPASTEITGISCGVNAATAVDTDGTAWVWGSGILVPSALELPTSSPVVEVSSGGYFHVVRTADGALYSWGNNGSGRLGRSELGASGSTTTPGRVDAVPTDVPVVGFSAARVSGIAWTADGRVFAWGETYGRQRGTELTFSDDASSLSAPADDGATATAATVTAAATDLPTEPPTTDPDDSTAETPATEENADASPDIVDTVDTSANDDGAPVADPEPDLAPEPEPEPEPVDDVGASSADLDPVVGLGAETASADVTSLGPITQAEVSDSAVYVIDGTGRTWRAPRAANTPLTPWAPGAGLEFVHVETSFSAASVSGSANEVGTFFLTRTGELYAYGNNADGQLGIDPATSYVSEPVRVPLPETPVSIAPGDRHTVLVSGEGHFYVAGDNTYGQTGSGLAGSTPISPFTAYPMRYWPAS